MSTISAGNTTTTAFKVTADTSGSLIFTTGGANTTALTLSNTQAATFTGALTANSIVSTGTVNALNTFGFENRLINGGMVIDQRNAGANVTINTTAQTYTVDRWRAYGVTSAGVYTVQQNAGAVTPPTGYVNYLGAKTTTANASVAAGSYYFLSQLIEGYNVADLGWGTASAKTVTLSFQVYSSLTGTFGGSVTNGAFNRSYPFTYTISSANTWTSISVTIAGDTSGTWLTTTGNGIGLYFDLGSGSSNVGTAGAWAAAGYVGATGDTKVISTLNATFYITGVQLEVGSSATSFDFRDYGRELFLCERYFEVSYNSSVVPGTVTNVGAVTWVNPTTISYAGNQVRYRTSKRTTPTLTLYSPITANTTGKISSVDVVTDYAASTCGSPGSNGFGVFSSSSIAGPATLNFHYTASAEL